MKIRFSFLILFFCYSNFVLAQLSSEEIDNISDWGKSNIEIDIKGTIDSLEKVVLILKNKNLKKKADIYSLLGGFYLTQLNDYEKALLYYEKINQLSIYHNNDPSILAKYHQDMGRLYIYEDTNIEKAFKEFKKAITILEKSNSEIPFEVYSNYSVALLGQDSVQKAIEHFNKSKNIFDQKKSHNNKDSSFLVLFSSNMGVSYLKSGRLDSAEFYLKQAVRLSQTLKQANYIFQSLVYLGVFYQEQSRYIEAISNFKLALELLPQIKYKYVYKKLLFESLADCYFSIGEYYNAHDFRQKQIVYTDSLRNQKLSEFSYVIEYKNKIESLKLKTKLDESEFKYLTQKKNTVILYIIIVLMLCATFLLFILFRLKKQKEINIEKFKVLKLEKEKIRQESEITILKSHEKLISAELEKGIVENEFNEIKSKLQEYLNKKHDPEFDGIHQFMKQIKSSEKKIDNLKLLDEVISYSNNQFYLKLKETNASLTNDEIKLLTFIRLNLSQKDITDYFGISKSSLNTKRYRVRKKLKLRSEVTLEDYLMML